MQRSIPVLMYHHVSPDREITPAGLERQLTHLLSNGYQSLSLDALQQVLTGQLAAPQRAFVITLDDGYLDNWLYAFPIFEKLRVHAAIYVITSRVENHSTPRTTAQAVNTRTQERSAGSFVSWAELQTMQRSGWITIGSHTHTHRDFIRRNPYSDIANELRQSKALIEENTGTSCRHLAWPWGDYQPAWKTLVRELGYTTAATTLGGKNARGTDPYELRRINVSRESLDWLEGRLSWAEHPLWSVLTGRTYGFDKRFKTWRKRESPYARIFS